MTAGVKERKGDQERLIGHDVPAEVLIERIEFFLSKKSDKKVFKP